MIPQSHSCKLQDAPRSSPTWRRSTCRQLLRGIASVALAFLLMPGLAFAACISSTSTLSPSPTQIVTNPSQNGTVVWTGTLTVSGIGCGGGPDGFGGYGITIAAPTAFSASVSDQGFLNGVTGLIAKFSFASAGGTCSSYFLPNWWNGFMGLGVAFWAPTPPATCNPTATWNVQFIMNTAFGPISGTVPTSAMIAGPYIGVGSGAWGRIGAWGDYWAYTGTTVTNGPLQFTAVSCTVSTPTLTVTLPTVSKTSLAASGSTAGLKPFSLTFTGCSSSSAGFSVTQTWSFTQGPASNIISSTGTAANVYAQILDSSMTPIANGGSNSFSVPAAGGSSTQQFYARYYSTGNGGAGSLTSTATFTLTYQ